MTYRKIQYTFTIFLLAFIVISGHSQSPSIVTVAGIPDSTGLDNGDRFESTFSRPHGIALDENSGNIYIADRLNNVIRKMTPEGIVSTFAGSGNPGMIDGVGSQAAFNDPWDVEVDSKGNIYVADRLNNAIRKITPAGIVTTFAGTGAIGSDDAPVAISASFYQPSGVAIDKDDNLYVADHLNHLIRKITPDGVVTTLAGSRDGDISVNNNGKDDGLGNAAKFYRPYGIEVAHDGNLYIADEWNHLIRKMTPEGLVTTIAGTGELGSTNGNALEATFNFPWDAVVDNDDNIYVADGLNHTIRRITPEGIVSTYAGVAKAEGSRDGEGALARFNAASGLTYDSDEDAFYVADGQNELIRKINKKKLINPEIGIEIYSGDPGNPGGGLGVNGFVCANDSLYVKVSPDTYTAYHYYVNNELVLVTDSSEVVIGGFESGNTFVQVIAFKNISAPLLSNVVSIDIRETPELSVSQSGPLVFCEGDSVILTASSSDADIDSYTWSNGISDPEIVIKESGTYNVQISKPEGCPNQSEDFIVEVIPTPEVDFNADKTLITEEDATVIFENLSEDATNYYWDFGDPDSGEDNFSSELNPSHIYSDMGEYTVTLRAYNDSCSSEIVKERYIVFDGEDEIFIPSAFSPNGDGNNDVLLVRSTTLRSIELTIYNQWGEAIYRGFDIDQGWDGTHNGQPVETGTYVYVLNAVNIAQRKVIRKGQVNVLK